MKNGIFLFILLLGKLYAYPHYIGHGYTTCKSCHYNPFGGGMVNDYGRVVNATSIASRVLYPDSVTDEEIAYHSDFLFGAYKPDHLRLQANYRGIKIISNFGSDDTETSRWITMQQDLRALVKYGENDKFIASASMSATPEGTRSSNGDSDEANYRSREHYLGYRYSPSVGIYAGLLDQVYGIRVVEHIAYSRLYPQITQNDQTHGVALHFLFDQYEGGIHGFMGNLSQDEDLRMAGFSGMLERTIADIHRVGASFKKSANEYLDLTAFAAHGRFSFKSGSSFQVELGQVNKTATGTDTNTSRYGLLQTYLRPYRGLYAFTNIEYGKRDIEADTYTIRWGPGLQYLPIHRTEFRLDLQNIRNFNEKKSVKDTWQLLLQTHFWL